MEQTKEDTHMLQVSAAIIRNAKGQILVCRRGPGGNCAYLWEFPGGKQEPSESPENASFENVRRNWH